MLEHILRDSSYKNKQKFALCYYSNSAAIREEFPTENSQFNPRGSNTSINKKNTLQQGQTAYTTSTSKNVPDLRRSVNNSIISRMSQKTMDSVLSGASNNYRHIQKRSTSIYNF